MIVREPRLSERPTPATQAQVAAARRRSRRSIGSARATATAQRYPLTNISATGALLETDGPLEVGQRLDLDLDLDGLTHVQVVAEVVRVQSPDWGRTGGIGVRFVDYIDDADRIINAFVEAGSARV